MKKMKFVTKGLALLMMGVMLAGCSDQTTESSSSDVKEESVAKSSEESKESKDESKETEESKPAESSEESKPAESSEESKPAESSEESKPAESSEESKPEESSAQAQISGDQEQRTQQYKEYFKNVSMEGKCFSMNMDMSSLGVPVTLAMSFGAKDGASYMYLGLPAQNSTEENGFSMYVMADQSAYLKMAIAGQKPAYYKTNKLSEENASSFNFADGLIDVGEGDRDVNLIYDHEEVIGGVTYDVLTMEESDTKGFVYMNQSTGEWEMMKVSEDGQEITVTIEALNAVTVSGEFASAEEVSEEDFVGAMTNGLMMLLLGSGAMNLD